MPSSYAQRLGAIAESKFTSECLERNFEPHMPVTPMPWDFIVTSPGGTYRVQVKSSGATMKGYPFYNIITSCGHEMKSPMSNEVDLVCCFAGDIEKWWVIPRKYVTGKTIKLYPNKTTNSKWKKFESNWSPFYG